MGPYPAGKGRAAGACANQAFSCRISLLIEGEHFWSWFQAAETTRQTAGITEPEEAQTLLGPMWNRGLGEN